MKPSIDLVAIGGCALAAAVLLVKYTVGDPFTPSYVRVLIGCGGILICAAGVIIHNQRAIKRVLADMKMSDEHDKHQGTCDISDDGGGRGGCHSRHHGVDIMKIKQMAYMGAIVGYVLCIIPLGFMMLAWVNPNGSGHTDGMMLFKLMLSVAVLVAYVGGFKVLEVSYNEDEAG